MDWLALYLEEDLGEAGDITSDALFADQLGAARLVARQTCVAAGVAVACEVFGRRGAVAEPLVADGARVAAGAPLLRVSGPARAILSAERTALNIVGRMAGIATMTRELAERLASACCPAVVAGTRKTTPGFRHYEKEAIRIGGGDPHRMGLYDAMMVKDNHLAALRAGARRAADGESVAGLPGGRNPPGPAGGQAVAGPAAGRLVGAPTGGPPAAAARAGAPGGPQEGLAALVSRLRAAQPGKLLEVEVESERDALAAAAAGADWILIDNQPPETGAAWAAAVWQTAPGVKVEASGGITPDNLLSYGWADRISLGALTHHAVSIDMGLDWEDA